jgi:hypothetical protein
MKNAKVFNNQSINTLLRLSSEILYRLDSEQLPEFISRYNIFRLSITACKSGENISISCGGHQIGTMNYGNGWLENLVHPFFTCSDMSGI